MKYLYFLLPALLSTVSLAQEIAQSNSMAYTDIPVVQSYPDRLEFDVETNALREPIVVPLGEAGLLYLLQTTRPVDRFSYRWLFVKCDTTLGEQWRGDYMITADQFYKTWARDGDNLYLLFGKQGSFDNLLYQINLQEGSVAVYNIYSLLKADLDRLDVSGYDALLTGNINTRPVVVHYDLNLRRSRVLSSIYGNNTEVDAIYFDPYTQDINVLLAVYRRRRFRLHLNVYETGGDLLHTEEIESSKARNFLSARLTTPMPGRQMAIGTYSDRSLYFPQGTFVLNWARGEREEVELSKFTEFDNFFNHLKPHRQERIKRRIFRRREKGKEYRVRYRFLLHDLVPVGDKYLFVAEAYYPQYRSESYRGSIGPSGYSSYRVFDGFRYTHTFLCMLDADGNRLWDNSLTMPSVVSYDLVEMAAVYTQGDTVTAVFSDEDRELIVNRLVNGEKLEEPAAIHYPMAHEGDEESKTKSLYLFPWYGNQLIAWGEQRIVNKDAPLSELNRGVFFISKVSAAPLPAQAEADAPKRKP
ncbi:hypothetical protein SAMN05421823_1057 [Catalinimonas alkaloidigena]|uniref:Uncharacterized protein n=1 Tax=Catalinimonas alkaloidigena TaxID=1075417 RepID=A0A1G9IHZ1_9BACT|nr:hypothetical protein [Catalinimonas alkaloidigena]SDL24712.1 hypothetical protein SAMN05421823_1057 [Catalinimonas alkaloidigena]